MTDISTWSKTDATNNDPLKSGMPEGMARSDVNNRNREHMGAIRRWYEDAEWVDLLSEDENNFTVLRVNATTFRAVNAVGIDATSKFAVGSWCRVTGTGGTTVVVGRIASIGAYSIPNVDVTLDTIKNASTWVTSDLPTTTVTKVEMYISKSAREATFHPVGVTLAQTPEQIPTIDQLSTVVTKDEGAGNGIDADTVDGLHAAAFALVGSAGGSASNLLTNGSMEIWQRGTPVDAASYGTNMNGNCCADRWLLLSQDLDSGAGSNPRFDISRVPSAAISLSDPEPFYRYALQLQGVNTDSATNSNKGGICQIVESSACGAARQDGKVSLSFDARKPVSSGITKIRCAVLRWIGSPDAMTATSIIGNTFAGWGGGNESTNPTLGTSWSYLADGAAATYKEFLVDDSWTTRYKFEGMVVPDAVDGNNSNNLAAFIWIQDTSYAASDTVQFAAVQLEVGATASDYAVKSIADEITESERYFSKTYNLEVEPKTVTDVGAVQHPSSVPATLNFAANEAFLPVSFPGRMRTTPTVTVIAPGTGTVGSVTGSVDNDLAAAGSDSGERGTMVKVTADPASTQSLKAHVVADAELG